MVIEYNDIKMLTDEENRIFEHALKNAYFDKQDDYTIFNDLSEQYEKTPEELGTIAIDIVKKVFDVIEKNANIPIEIDWSKIK